MKCNFYDIESLSNVFTLANYRPDENCVDIYYLIDNAQTLIPVPDDKLLEDITREVLAQNRNFNGSVMLFDLHTESANDRLFRTFGLSDAIYINKPDAKSSYPAEYRLTCDTDPVYNEENDPYLLGYNSYHYDTTMLTLYMYNTCMMDGKKCSMIPPSAKVMRELNNQLQDANLDYYKKQHAMYEQLNSDLKDLRADMKRTGEKLAKDHPDSESIKVGFRLAIKQ